jgi:hypothetical protein
MRGPGEQHQEPRRLIQRHTCVVMTVRALSGCCAMALLVAGCSSGGGDHATPTTRRANAPTTVTTAPFTPVAASRSCLIPMRRLIALNSSPGVPSGMTGEAAWYAAIDSLMHCKSKAEWLSAAQESLTRANANDYSASLLQRYCETRVNFGIRFNPADAPSCAVRSVRGDGRARSNSPPRTTGVLSGGAAAEILLRTELADRRDRVSAGIAPPDGCPVVNLCTEAGAVLSTERPTPLDIRELL